MMKHIVLIGFMGAGKTSVGKSLAYELKIPFVDMDDEIVKKAGMPITEIFAEYGEPHFRKIETDVLEELLDLKERHVISAGGGVPMREVNQPLLKQAGVVVYLKTDTEILVKRLQDDTTRPILHGGDLREKITVLQAKREPIYKKVSDFQVITDEKSLSEIVSEIGTLVECGE